MRQKVNFAAPVFVMAAFLLSACGNGTTTDAEPCNLNSDCANPEATCVAGECRVDCVEDRDCAEGEICEMSLCISGAIPCRGDEDCTFNQECVQGLCVEIEGFCERNRDCPDGQACSGRTFRCISTSGRGGDCTDDLDCFADELCISERCEPRSTNECARNSDCNDAEICLEGRCAPECVEDRDCGSGEVCDGGECVADPGGGAVCGNGACEQGEDTQNCPGDCQAAPVCGNGVCEQGETAQSCPGDCQMGPVCGNGVCDQGETTQSCPGDCQAQGGCLDNPGLCTPAEECCEGTCVARGQCVAEDYWDVCGARAECSSMLCLGDPNTGIGHCTERCGSRADCPQQPASFCISPQQIITNQPRGNELIGLCFADDTGVSCNPLAPNNCFDGVCVDRRINNQVSGQCTLRCQVASDCLPGYGCGPRAFDVEGNTEVINVCLPVGTACQGVGSEAADQCHSGVCLTDDENNNQGVCSVFCIGQGSCPTGWACQTIGESSVCLPQ